MNRRVRFPIGLALAWVAISAMAEPPVASHDDSFSKEGLFKANVAALKDTQLVAQPDMPLTADQNMLWCGTLQLAWNQAIDLVGEKLRFTTPSPVADLLNRESFTSADLDAASYVAVADFERNHVENEIRTALAKVFNGVASPELIPPVPKQPGPDDFVAYAYLYKNLAFADPFEDNDPMPFEGQPVKNFGFIRNTGKLSPDVFRQVQIYDYKSEDDFIIKLKSKSPNDELILAKITPSSTLQSTIDTVLGRIGKSAPVFADKRDKLAVPNFNFDLRRDFQELEGLILQPTPAARIKNKLVIAKAEQLVRFQLNEKGAILKSEATIIMRATAIMVNPEKPHIMRFDRPFLILMKRAESDHPYFALWVGNASLLVPAEKP
jgi:hypothetical protein